MSNCSANQKSSRQPYVERKIKTEVKISFFKCQAYTVSVISRKLLHPAHLSSLCYTTGFSSAFPSLKEGSTSSHIGAGCSKAKYFTTYLAGFAKIFAKV